MARASPRYIQLFPTFQCTAACRFCFVRDVPREAEMDLASFQRLVRSMASSGIAELDILGGEPTLHPHLADMLALSAAHGISTTLSTNGSNVRSLSALSDMVERGSLRVGVSLNGDDVPADLHHYITAHRPLLKSVCTRDRVLPGAAIPYLGDPRVEYYLIYLDTLSREELALGMPFHEFSDTLAALSARYANIRGVYCSGFVAGQGDPLLQQVRCPAGTTKLSVMPDGDIYPCYLLMGHGEFRLGNVREDGFAAVMEHPALDFFRRYEGNPCARSACALIGSCHGGCPAVSLRITGDLSRPDPRCSPDEETHSRAPAAKLLKKKDGNGNMT